MRTAAFARSPARIIFLMKSASFCKIASFLFASPMNLHTAISGESLEERLPDAALIWVVGVSPGSETGFLLDSELPCVLENAELNDARSRELALCRRTLWARKSEDSEWDIFSVGLNTPAFGCSLAEAVLVPVR